MTSAIARPQRLRPEPLVRQPHPLAAHATAASRSSIADDGIRGVTSNPTIFEKAMAARRGLRRAARASRAGEGLRIDGQRTGRSSSTTSATPPTCCARSTTRPTAADGFVSVEVVARPRARHRRRRSRRRRSCSTRLGRPNVMIKIPATLEGLPAIDETIAAGINVNVTLIFSLDRHDAVIDAYLTGLERLAASGGDLVDGHLGRVVLREPGRHRDRPPPPRRSRRCGARPRSRTPSSRTSCSAQRFAGARWDALAAKGARLQRPLWASTSTKNPAYSPTLYVDELIGRDTVNTLAPASIEALHEGDAEPARRHGRRGRRRAREQRDRRRSPTRASTSTT